MRHPARLMITVATIIILLLAGGSFLIMRHKQPDPLSPALRQRISFIVYYPSSGWKTTARQTTYNGGVLTLHAIQDTETLTITEQATPAVFNDVPQYYPSLVRKLNEYDNFGTLYGTVYLTKPKELSGQQQAVLNNNGTLLFAHPGKNLDTDTWRRFFNGLQVLKP